MSKSTPSLAGFSNVTNKNFKKHPILESSSCLFHTLYQWNSIFVGIQEMKVFATSQKI